MKLVIEYNKRNLINITLRKYVIAAAREFKIVDRRLDRRLVATTTFCQEYF